MTLSDIPWSWWVIGWFAAMVLLLGFVALSSWLSQRRLKDMPKKLWLYAKLCPYEDMAKFEASDAIAVNFASHDEYLKMAREEPNMHKWRRLRLKWDSMWLATDSDDLPAPAAMEWTKPPTAPSGVFLIEWQECWGVLIGPMAFQEQQHRVFLSDDGYPCESLTLEQVYRNWKHPRLPAVRA